MVGTPSWKLISIVPHNRARIASSIRTSNFLRSSSLFTGFDALCFILQFEARRTQFTYCHPRLALRNTGETWEIPVGEEQAYHRRLAPRQRTHRFGCTSLIVAITAPFSGARPIASRPKAATRHDTDSKTSYDAPTTCLGRRGLCGTRRSVPRGSHPRGGFRGPSAGILRGIVLLQR